MRALTALTAALLATSGLALSAAEAQAPRALNLSREERDSIAALQVAAAGLDRTAQDAALSAARVRAQTASARYAVAHFQFQIGRQRGDYAMQSQGAEAMIESGLVTPEEAPGLVAYLAGRSLGGRDSSRTDRLMARLVELQPTNSAVLVDYGQFTAGFLPSARGAAAVTVRAKAVSLFQRAFDADQAAGRISPESWYLRGLAVAYDGTLPPVSNASFAPANSIYSRSPASTPVTRISRRMSRSSTGSPARSR